MIAPLLRPSSGVSQGHAEFVQQVNERVAKMRHDILLVEKFSALLLWPFGAKQNFLLSTARHSRECCETVRRINHAKRSTW